MGDEWVQVGQGTLHCQLDTGAQASVMTTKQLRSVAPDERIRKTHKRFVSYSQHHADHAYRMCNTESGTRAERDKGEVFIIYQAQNQMVYSFKQLLIQHSDLESATESKREDPNLYRPI